MLITSFGRRQNWFQRLVDMMWLVTPRRLTRAVAVGLLSLAAAGCGSDGGGATSSANASADSVLEDPMVEDSMVDEMTDEAMTDEAMVEDSMVDEMTEIPAWQSLAITDVDGVEFTLDDFHGRPVLVETFATWCPTCRAQLADTSAAATAAGDDAVVVALSVETDIASADVKDYAEENGFAGIRFAVVSPEMLAALVDGFGQSIANPPSTPKFVIDAMGHAGELTTGAESAETLAMHLGVTG